MAIEKENQEQIEEEVKVDTPQEQPEGLPPEVMVEGQEPVVEDLEEEFSANLADGMDERILKSLGSDKDIFIGPAFESWKLAVFFIRSAITDLPLLFIPFPLAYP